jgi:hypothetical protein
MIHVMIPEIVIPTLLIIFLKRPVLATLFIWFLPSFQFVANIAVHMHLSFRFTQIRIVKNYHCI